MRKKKNTVMKSQNAFSRLLSRLSAEKIKRTCREVSEPTRQRQEPSETRARPGAAAPRQWSNVCHSGAGDDKTETDRRNIRKNEGEGCSKTVARYQITELRSFKISKQITHSMIFVSFYHFNRSIPVTNLFSSSPTCSFSAL